MAREVMRAPLYQHTMQRLEEVKKTNSQGDDFWIAREIHAILGYRAWDKFVPVIQKAEDSIKSQGGDPSQHIAHTSKMVGLGEGARRRVNEYFLSRGACYLIAMNGDPTKPEIAGAQAYFATQTRAAELSQQEFADRKRLSLREKVTDAFKRVSNTAHDAGVSRFALFHNARFQGLYGASKREVDRMKGLGDGEQLFDRAGALELSAHEFQMQLAATKIVNEHINGEKRCIDANLAVAKNVRQTILDQSGAKLEDVPLEREPIASVRKRLLPPTTKLPKS